jgi:hypothetical protein
MSRTKATYDVLDPAALKAVNDLTADATPDGTLDYALTYDASAAAAKKVLLHKLISALPRSYLAGYGMANSAGDATNDIDFAVGAARDSTNAVNLIAATAMTKQLDAAWAAGTAAGGRMSAAAIANTTYFCYAIRKDTDGTVDFGFDTSASAPTMPAGYTYFRRIGSVLRESAALVTFVQDGDWVQRAPVLSINAANPGTSAVTATLGVPVGVRVQAHMNAGVLQTTGVNEATVLLLSDLSVADAAASASAAPLGQMAAFATNGVDVFSDNGFGQVRIWTNTSGQIRYRLSASSAQETVKIVVTGWLDRRGQDA